MPHLSSTTGRSSTCGPSFMTSAVFSTSPGSSSLRPALSRGTSAVGLTSSQTTCTSLGRLSHTSQRVLRLGFRPSPSSRTVCRLSTCRSKQRRRSSRSRRPDMRPKSPGSSRTSTFSATRTEACHSLLSSSRSKPVLQKPRSLRQRPAACSCWDKTRTGSKQRLHSKLG